MLPSGKRQTIIKLALSLRHIPEKLMWFKGCIDTVPIWSHLYPQQRFTIQLDELVCPKGNSSESLHCQPQGRHTVKPIRVFLKLPEQIRSAIIVVVVTTYPGNTLNDVARVTQHNNNCSQLSPDSRPFASKVLGPGVVSCPDPTLSRGKGSGDHWAISWLCRVSKMPFAMWLE